MAGSWSTKLHTILRPAWDSTYDNVKNPKAHRHPPGVIWKKVLGKSVFLDLAGDSFERRRRFVRLETLGLSGIIFYEISSGHDPDGSNSLDGAPEGPWSTTRLTRKSVFGDPYTPSDLGMGIDKLIDVVGAKVLYFPAYACTSFSSGQAMNAFLNNRPSLQPLPASEGFSVGSGALPLSCIGLTESSVNSPYPPTSCIHFLSTSSSIERTSCDQPASASVDSSIADPDSDDENDVSVSTVSSIGPCTPPRIFSGSQTVQTMTRSSFALNFDGESELGYVLCDAIDFFDRPISPGIVVTQAAKTGPSKTLNAADKENSVPVMKV